MLAAAPPRDDQRPRIAAAEVPRRGAGASRGHRRRAETGVTIMRVVDALDAGAMFAKVDAADRPRRDQRRRRARPRRARRRLLLEVVDQIAGGTAQRRAAGLMLATLRAAADEGRRADRLDAARGVDSQPRPRPVSVAARLHVSRRRRVILLKTRVEPDTDRRSARARSWTSRRRDPRRHRPRRAARDRAAAARRPPADAVRDFLAGPTSRQPGRLTLRP